MIKNPHRRRTIPTNEGGLVLYDQARNDMFHKHQPITTTTATTITQHDVEEMKRVHSLFVQQEQQAIAIRHPSITTLMLLQCQVSLIQAISTIPSKRQPTTNFVKLTVSSGQQVLRWSMLCGLFVLDNVSRVLGVENEMVSLDDESTVFVDGQVDDDHSSASYRRIGCNIASSSNSSNSNHSEDNNEAFPSSLAASSQTPVPDLSLSQTSVSRPSSDYSISESPVVDTNVSQKQNPIAPELEEQSQAPAPTMVTQPKPHQSSSTPPSPPPCSSQPFSLPPRRSSPTPAHINNNNTPVATNNVISSRLPVARTRKISLPVDSAAVSHSHVRSLSNNMTMPSQHASLPTQLHHHHQQQPSLRRSTGRRDLASTLSGNHSGVSLNNITVRPQSTSSTDDITQVHYHHHHHYHQDQIPSPSSTRRSASSMAKKVLPWRT
ncbi:hypothetical protein INT45_002308 [Circinella minor]|uniref:Uncharacterized protein n=1 Tax=Circinella minor TaxID=1195481 RepID=A0A8H7SGF2_9FUNG|nr:hypothetical protein INT45_002308 [Circinella minor]